MDDLSARLRKRFAGNQKVLAMIDRVDSEYESELAAIGNIDPATMEAVRQLEYEENVLKQLYANNTITRDEYLTQWGALMDETPHSVIRASTKIMQTLISALGRPPGTIDA